MDNTRGILNRFHSNNNHSKMKVVLLKYRNWILQNEIVIRFYSRFCKLSSRFQRFTLPILLGRSSKKRLVLILNRKLRILKSNAHEYEGHVCELLANRSQAQFKNYLCSIVIRSFINPELIIY